MPYTPATCTALARVPACFFLPALVKIVKFRSRFVADTFQSYSEARIFASPELCFFEIAHAIHVPWKGFCIQLIAETSVDQLHVQFPIYKHHWKRTYDLVQTPPLLVTRLMQKFICLVKECPDVRGKIRF